MPEIVVLSLIITPPVSVFAVEDHEATFPAEYKFVNEGVPYFTAAETFLTPSKFVVASLSFTNQQYDGSPIDRGVPSVTLESTEEGIFMNKLGFAFHWNIIRPDPDVQAPSEMGRQDC